MTGMTAMSNAVTPLQDEVWFTNLFIRFSNPLLGVLVGALVTGIIQSSSASVGILQALSSTGVITYGSAIPIIMGQNIGTCVTALISSVGANKNARRAAMVHLYFNIIGVTLFLAMYYGLNLVLHFTFVNDTVTAWGIAVIHSVFNIAATAVLLPFANVLEKLAILTIPDDAEKESFALLDERLLKTPAVAVERARAATADMAELARVGVVQAMSLTHQWDDTLAQKSGTKRQGRPVRRCPRHLSGQAVQPGAEPRRQPEREHPAPHHQRFRAHQRPFRESAQLCRRDPRQEHRVLPGCARGAAGSGSAVQDVLSRTTDAFRKADLHLASKVEPMETVVDELVRAIKHGMCPPAGWQLLHRIRLRAGRPADQL